MTGVLIRREIWGQTGIEGKEPCGAGGRGCGSPSVSRGVPGLAGSPQKLDETGRERSYPRALGGNRAPLPGLQTLGLQSCDRFRVCCFKAPPPFVVLCCGRCRKPIWDLSQGGLIPT